MFSLLLTLLAFIFLYIFNNFHFQLIIKHFFLTIFLISEKFQFSGHCHSTNDDHLFYQSNFLCIISKYFENIGNGNERTKGYLLVWIVLSPFFSCWRVVHFYRIIFCQHVRNKWRLLLACIDMLFGPDNHRIL